MFKLIVVSCFLGLVSAVNYCDPKLCPAGVKHIACEHSGSFSPSCPSDKRIAAISEANQELIVDVHNTLRNRIANGDQSGFPSARRMATMVNYFNN